MLRKILVINSVVFASLMGFFLQTANTEGGRAILYKDKNGYFAVISPEGWKREDYPSETVRSKVAFHHPIEKRVFIRIISAPLPDPKRTFNDFYAETKEKLGTYFRQNVPNSKCDINKGKMGNLETIIARISAPPEVYEQEIVTFMDKGIQHSVTFGATTKGQFDKNYKTFQQFLSNFVVMETARKFSDQEIRMSLVAKYKRLAELHEQSGLIEQALDFVTEGLSIDPSNKDLIAIEKRLQTKRSKK